MRLNKDGTPDKRQFKYLHHGHLIKPTVEWKKEQAEKRRRKHIEQNPGYMQEYRKNNHKHLIDIKNERLNEVKHFVYVEFGGCCNCCGEKDIRFMTIDHINGRSDKNGQRKSGKKLWRYVWTLGCPKDQFQMLCYNCNCAKGVYGVCPHKIREKGGG